MRTRLAGLAVGIGLLGSVPAAALSMLPNPVLLTATNFQARVELVDVVQGLPPGALGSVGPTDTTLIFRVTVDEAGPGSPAFSNINISLEGEPYLSGWNGIPGPDIDVKISVIIPPLASFYFEKNGVRGADALAAGDVTDLFYASWPLPPESLIGLDIQFLEISSGVLGVAQLVPEPSTGVLVALGLLLLGRAGRRATA